MILKKIDRGWQFFCGDRVYLVYRIEKIADSKLEMICFRWFSPSIKDCLECSLPVSENGEYDTSGLLVGKEVSIGYQIITTGLAVADSQTGTR